MTISFLKLMNDISYKQYAKLKLGSEEEIVLIAHDGDW